MKSYDLAIIGAGPGGYVAALYAARQKIRTCVIEKDLVGGTCLNRGCIPTKTMLHSAELLNRIKESSQYGIDIDYYTVNFKKIISRKTDVVTRLRSGIETLFRAAGIDLIRGSGTLAGTDAIKVGDDTINAKSIIIASGSVPASLKELPFDEADILSSDGILETNDFPGSIIIVGGGVIGCEFASLLNAFGTKVYIVEMMERLLLSQSREASKKMEASLKKRGMDVCLSSRIELFTKGMLCKAKISNGREIEAEKILVSIGRAANISGMGIEAVGIRTEKGRIAIDEFSRTSIPNIYAIGDCVGGPLLAHKASYEGMLAVDNILGKKRKIDYSIIPNCIYTDPEIASVGLSEEDAKARYGDIKIAKFPYLGLGKAYLIGRTEGYIKMVGDAKGKILGIEIFGESACDLIGEAALAKAVGMTAEDMSRVVHAHPSLSELFQEVSHAFCGTPIHGL